MNIKCNEIDKSIEIKDGLKNHYFILKLLMVLNLLNAILRLYDARDTEFGFQEIIWLLLGIISVVALYFFIAKRSALVEFRKLLAEVGIKR